MKKKIRMRAAAILMAAVMMICGGTTVFAAYSTEIGTAENYETLSIDKYLVMDQSATVPNATFTYKVEAGAAKTFAGTAGTTSSVLQGVDAQNIKMTGDDVQSAGTTETSASYTLNFYKSDDDEALSDKYYGGNLTSYNSEEQKYVKKTLKLDFTKCAFTEPGIYRYTLTETDSNQGITSAESSETKWIDVYVENASETSTSTGLDQLKITGYAVYANENTIYVDNTTTGYVKSGSFTSLYDTSDLTFCKEVSGNQASKDKYFKFTVKIDNAVENTVYQVVVEDDIVKDDNSATKEEYKGEKNSTSLTANEPSTDTKYTGKYCTTAIYYLRHGQKITIKGLAKDTYYEVTEDAEDYSSEEAKVEGYTDSVKGMIASKDINTSYLNTRAGTIPTGIILTIAPFAAAVLIGGAGLVMILMKKRKARES